MERTASFCTPAFLPQPGAGFHPLPWEQQPDAHSRLSTSGNTGHCQSSEHISPRFLVFPLSELTKRIAVLPTDILLLKPQGDCAGGPQNPEGQWEVFPWQSWLGSCACVGLTRGQTHPSELAQLCWLVLNELEHGAFQLCQPHQARERRPGPAGLRFSSSPGKLPLVFSIANFTVCAKHCEM